MNPTLRKPRNLLQRYVSYTRLENAAFKVFHPRPSRVQWIGACLFVVIVTMSFLGISTGPVDLWPILVLPAYWAFTWPHHVWGAWISKLNPHSPISPHRIWAALAILFAIAQLLISHSLVESLITALAVLLIYPIIEAPHLYIRFRNRHNPQPTDPRLQQALHQCHNPTA